MVAQYTTADLIADIKQEGMIPTSQTTWSTERMLELATRELRSHLVPFIARVREGYFVWDHTLSLSSGVSEYAIPSRAVALSLDDVLAVINSNDEISLTQINASERDHYSSAGGEVSFYLRNNKIIFTSDPSSRFQSIKIPFLIRLGSLVETSNAAKITAINTGTGVVTVNAVPSDYTTSLAYDLIKGEGGYEYRAIDQSASAVDANAGTLTFSSLPDDLAVGDWISVAGESPLPQIPIDFIPILIQRCLIKIAKSLGKKDLAESAKEELREAQTGILALVTPRVKNEPKYIVSGMRRRHVWFGR